MRPDRPLLERPFDEAFRWLLLAVVLWSYTALAATGQLPLWLAVGGFPLLLTAWIGERRFPLPPRLWHAIIAAFLCLDGWVFVRLGRIDAFVYFLIFLLVNKLWTPKKTRDILQVLLISFFFMVAASIMTTRMSFLLTFVVFLFLLILSLIFLTVRREHDALRQLGVGRRAGVNPDEIVPAQFYARVWGAALLTLLVTVWIFALFPRFSTNNFLLPMASRIDKISRSGFGYEIRLGSSSRITLSSTDVLRIRVEDRRTPGARPMEGIYLRGAVVDTYEEGRWRTNELLHPTRSKPDFTVRFDGKHLPAPGARRELRQEVFLDPAAGPNLFTLESAARIDFSPNHEVRVEIDDAANTCRLLEPRGEILTYRAVSYVRPPEAGDPDKERPAQGAALHTVPLLDRQAHLQLPETPRAEETRQLAESIVEQAGAVTRYEKARAIESYLQTHFTYSLTDLDLGGADPTETFLHNVRRGNCEYFASGMAVLLRRLGIPCRIVSGYYTNRWNRVMNYFLVKEWDAHSWVEAHFPSGWVAFDPTPPDSIVRVSSQMGPWRDLANWIDAIRMRWYLHVIDYNLGDQRQLIGALGDGTPRLANALARWGFQKLRSLSPGMARDAAGRMATAIVVGLAAGAAVVAALSVAALVARRRRLSRSYRLSVARRRVRIYERILAWLGRRGLPRPPAATPREHARYVEAVRPDLIGLCALTERYYAARYAEAFLTENDEALFRHFLRRVRLKPPKTIYPR